MTDRLPKTGRCASAWALSLATGRRGRFSNDSDADILGSGVPNPLRKPKRGRDSNRPETGLDDLRNTTTLKLQEQCTAMLRGPRRRWAILRKPSLPFDSCRANLGSLKIKFLQPVGISRDR